MKLDNFTTLKLDEEFYNLKYDINALIKLEALISTKNIARMATDLPMSHSDTIICLMTGLEKDHPSMNVNKAKNLFGRLLKKYSLVEIQTIIVAALVESGAMGKSEETETTEPFAEGE